MSLRQRRLPAVAWCIVLAGTMFAPCRLALALDALLDVSQYAHTSWKIRDGFVKGRIVTVVQTPDGYLWLGTEFGLVRFDGVRAVPWQPPAGQSLPDDLIRTLFVARDGTLWIGTTFGGLVSWKGGDLTKYPQVPAIVNTVLEDAEGTIWVGAGTFQQGWVCAIRKQVAECSDEDGSFGRWASVARDSKNGIWVGSAEGLWRWRPGPPQLYRLPHPIASIDQFMAETGDGAYLIATSGGIVRLTAEGKVTAPAAPLADPDVRPIRIFRDRDGALWGTEYLQGIVHFYADSADLYTVADGLSSDAVNRFFEDREGNIWVSTEAGLDRFRELPAPLLSTRQGLAATPPWAVLAVRDGSVWFATPGGLQRWRDGRMTTVSRWQDGAALPAVALGHRGTAVSLATVGTLLGRAGALFEDSRGRMWATTDAGVGYLQNDRFTRVVEKASLLADAITEDGRGNIWIAHRELGLLRVSQTSQVARTTWAALGVEDVGHRLAGDPSGDGVWIGYLVGGVAHYRDGRIQASYGVGDGLGQGGVNDLRLEQDGALWIATEGGLNRLKNGRIATLTSQQGLPCDSVHAIVADDSSVWVYMACGLSRVTRADLEAWTAAVERGTAASHRVPVAVFDSGDGIRAAASISSFGPHLTRAVDGKLWFAALDSVGVIDPDNVPRNTLAPPVHIEQIVADRRAYPTPGAGGRVSLPALVRDLQIDYAGLSLVAPEKMLFRYQLEGYERAWHDVGTRRQAFYSQLPPGDYRFRVIASNNNGVWNQAGASLDFSIAPAFFQTTWFRVSCVVAFLALLALLYRMRLTHLQRQFNMRLEARIAERTRIARELHDTLLQSFQGVLLMAGAATDLVPDRPAEAHQKLRRILDQAEEALAQGREAVHGLRSSTAVRTGDLGQDLRRLADELMVHQPEDVRPEVRVEIEGAEKSLVPIVRDEAYRVAMEALRNALQHAQARLIAIELRYERRRFRLWVSDDGKGIDEDVLAAGGRSGHFGLAGMYERARLCSGELAVRSRGGAGTEVELTIPASVAYARVARATPAQ